MLIILVIASVVGGLVASFVSYARLTFARVGCVNNMRLIGMSIRNYHDVYRCFPAGTMRNNALPPEKRFSWLMEIMPFAGGGGRRVLVDLSEPWDSATNRSIREERRINRAGNTIVKPMPEFLPFMCPSNPNRADASLPGATHYVGISGLGLDAAELTLSDRRAGFFGYDRVLSDKDISDGLSTTMAVAEVTDARPWTAGGPATVHGVVPGARPYLGEGGQFSSFHRGGGVLAWRRPVVTHVIFADGSVRGLTPSISPQVFEAMATVAGGDKVSGLPSEP